MPTELPERRPEDAEFPGMPLFVVPVAILCLSALADGDGLNAPALLRMLLRAGEALVEGEIGFGRTWAERLARPG